MFEGVAEKIYGLWVERSVRRNESEVFSHDVLSSVQAGAATGLPATDAPEQGRLSVMQKILFASEWDCAKRLTFKIRTSENQIKTMTLELGQHRKERTKASLPEKRGRGG